jgi:hypothetical protein
VTQVNDSYVVLRKGKRGQFSTVSSATGWQHARACAKNLNTQNPGKYLLLNLRTKLIEDWERTRQPN